MPLKLQDLNDTVNTSALSYKRLKDLVPFLVDQETGIVAYLEELLRQFDMPDFIYYKAEIANTGIFGLEMNHPTSGGVSLDRDRAIAKALGEAVERYCSAIYFRDELPLSAYADLSVQALEPEQFKQHSPAQLSVTGFPLTRFTEHTPVRWAKGSHWRSGDQFMAPAAFVYCPYNADRNAGEAQIAESVSTGLAAHCSYEEAALNGLLEVVERDNFMLHWYAGESCPVLIPESLSPLHREMIRRFEVHGYTVNILLATMDSVIPTVIGMLHGQRKGNVPLVLSSASHPDPAVAITKALEELALMERLSKRAMLTTTNWPESHRYAEIRTLGDHLRFWLNPGIVRSADFLISDTERISLDAIADLSTGDPVSDLARAVDCVESTGHKVYFYDVTTSDIRALGMHVVRAIVPGYVPLTIQYRCRPEGNKRLLKFNTSRKSNKNGASFINPLPHPFA